FNRDVDTWCGAAQKRNSKLTFPSDPDEELILRYHIIEKTAESTDFVFRFGVAQGQHKHDDQITIFRTLIVRPFVEDLSHRLGEAADLATPEARAMQAVPLNRIPSPKEVKIFLSHK